MNGQPMVLVWRRLAGCLLPLLLLGLMGCSKAGNLHGKATYKGEPLPKGTRITFKSEQADQTVTTDVKDDDGNYTAEKVPVGTVKVGVIAPQPLAMPNIRAGGKDKGGINFGPPAGSQDVAGPPTAAGGKSGIDPRAVEQKTMQIPLKYKEPEKSPLSVDVKGGKQEFNIELTD